MNSTLRIGMLIHSNREWLGPGLVDKADRALSAHEDRQYVQAVVEAGAFLEGLLVQMLERWGTSTPVQPTLGPLIGALRKCGRAPGELLERLNEANTIRNRAPHDKPRLLRVTQGDALQMLHILGLAVDWCREHFGNGDEQSLAPALPIFLSVGGPHRLDQQQFLQRLRAEMRALGVALAGLPPGTYSPEKPFDQIREVMSSCKAALIVGLERSHAYTVFERERSEREKLYQDQYIPTAWNQIEGAIASALLLPVLILREVGLHREGIFEAENHRHRIHPFDLKVESKRLSPELRHLLATWVQDVQKTTSVASTAHRVRQ